MSEYSRRLMVDRKLNQWSLFSKIIGNDAAVECLADFCYQCLSNHEHFCPNNIMLAGPASSGKTTLTKTVANILCVTDVIVDGPSLSRTQTLIDAVISTYAKKDCALNVLDCGTDVIELPVTLVFIDEIHAVPPKVQEGLLKATERNDGMLFGKDCVLDCKNVMWFGATTDWGKLTNAFRTRFRRVDVVAPTFSEVCLMIQKKYGYSEEVCNSLVKFGGTVPRETFAFVESVQNCANRSSCSIQEAIGIISARENIDSFGMKIQRLKILECLYKKPCILRDLTSVVGCQQEELLNHWLPPMIVSGLIVLDKKYCITPIGIQELEKRNSTNV